MKSKLVEEVLSDLRKKRAPKDEPKDESGGDEGDEEDEVNAMRDFEDSSTPEDKARALRAFLEVCVPRIVKR